ncbi:hypothetical protein [Labilibaculum euxinus]
MHSSFLHIWLAFSEWVLVWKELNLSLSESVLAFRQKGTGYLGAWPGKLGESSSLFGTAPGKKGGHSPLQSE